MKKHKPNPKKHVFSGKIGSVPTSILLSAEGGANAHEWAYAADLVNFSDRDNLESTTVAHTVVEGLNRKTDYAFFHKAVYPGNANVWEGPIFVTTG